MNRRTRFVAGLRIAHGSLPVSGRHVTHPLCLTAYHRPVFPLALQRVLHIHPRVAPVQTKLDQRRGVVTVHANLFYFANHPFKIQGFSPVQVLVNAPAHPPLTPHLLLPASTNQYPTQPTPSS